jgi:hypothetical protein
MAAGFSAESAPGGSLAGPKKQRSKTQAWIPDGQAPASEEKAGKGGRPEGVAMWAFVGLESPGFAAERKEEGGRANSRRGLCRC